MLASVDENGAYIGFDRVKANSAFCARTKFQPDYGLSRFEQPLGRYLFRTIIRAKYKSVSPTAPVQPLLIKTARWDRPSAYCMANRSATSR